MIDFDAIIAGSGFAGLAAAIEMKRQKKRFVVLEKAGSLGGTWRDNHYPGCACDVPSHLYSFSFAPNPRWSRHYAPQSEILEYLERCADDFALRPHLRFGSEVTRAEWDENLSCWRVHTTDKTLTARWLVMGIGALSRPSFPEIPGLAKFRGKLFHSARWDHQYPLERKTVAVVGTGASAIQFVPKIAPRVARLHLYQRTPPWILPRPDRAISPAEQKLYSALPLVQRLHRYLIYWTSEARVCGFALDPRLMKIAAAVGRRHLERQVRDPALREKLLPKYMPGCKRILMANDYYPAIARDNVELITDEIREVTEDGVVTRDGKSRAVDAILCGTGFRVNDFLAPIQVLGRGGVDLNQAWRDGAQALLGTTIAGYPNLFMLTGPNTGLGHSSMVFMIESQVRYLAGCMRAAERRGARALEPRSSVQASFNEKLHGRLDHTVWSTGCKSWYLDDHGRNNTLWPGFTFEFWLRTRRPRAAHYSFDVAET